MNENKIQFFGDSIMKLITKLLLIGTLNLTTVISKLIGTVSIFEQICSITEEQIIMLLTSKCLYSNLCVYCLLLYVDTGQVYCWDCMSHIR